MITKTKFSSGGKVALNLAKYIERGVKENRIYPVLYYGFRPFQSEDMEELKGFSSRVQKHKPGVRHMIIAPERILDEREFHILVLILMDKWIRITGNYGIRYVWGLHYNTEHPHAHIGMVSSYSEDLIMERRDLKEFNKIVEEVFHEKIKGEEKVNDELEKEIEEAEEFEVEH